MQLFDYFCYHSQHSRYVFGSTGYLRNLVILNCVLENTGSVAGYSHCLWGFCVWSLSSYTVLCVLSSFAIISLRKRELVAFLWLSFLCHVTVSEHSVSLLCCAVGWSAVCDCRTSLSYSQRGLPIVNLMKTDEQTPASLAHRSFCLFVLFLYLLSQQLWS